jgi:hypothetical protein
MHNKTKSWTDVQLIISSFSIALTLGFWGLFASQDKSGSGVTGEIAVPTQPDPVISTAPPVLLPGQKLLFGGTSPQSLSQLQTKPTPQQVIITVKKHGGGGSGGGGGAGAHAGTGSSHP